MVMRTLFSDLRNRLMPPLHRVAVLAPEALHHRSGALLPRDTTAAALKPPALCKLMILGALPLAALPRLVADGAPAAAPLLGIAALWWSALWVLAQGLRAEREWRSHANARRPALPRKRIGVLGAMLALFGAGCMTANPGIALLQAATGGALMCLTFGRDPARDREGAQRHIDHRDEVAQTIERAKARSTFIHDLLRHNAPELLAEFAYYEATLNRLCGALHAQPEQLLQARAHLGPELDALEQETRKLSVVLAAAPEDDAVGNYRAVLDQMTRAARHCVTGLHATSSRSQGLELGILGDVLARKV